MKTCAYCAEAIPEDAQFCQFCGSNLAALGTPVAATGSAGVVAPEQVHTSGKAIASLICGIFFFVFPSAIIAIILGHLSTQRSAAAWDESEEKAWRSPA